MKKGGNKKKRGVKEVFQKQDLIFKEQDQEYATVLKLLGDCRVEVDCKDGIKRIAHIRGKMKKKVYIYVGDLVLIGLRDFEDDKADIIHRYTPEDIKALKSYGEFEEPVTEEKKESEDCAFEFDEI